MFQSPLPLETKTFCEHRPFEGADIEEHMHRTIRMQLNKFSKIPSALLSDPKQNVPLDEIPVDLGSLYHHYYMDSYEISPPNPNPAEFEYLRFLLPTADFRYIQKGPGAGTVKRRSISTEMGQAFCRWFLHEHLGITYFAHMEDVLDRTAHPAFGGICIKRSQRGDVPDYLCAQSSKHSYIAEAKGRYSSINFANTEFQEWRDQFTRIQVEDAKGNLLSLKGYISATRFATETRPSRFTTIYVEDPVTPGEQNPEFQGIRQLGIGTVALHYSTPLLKLGLRLLSAGLLEGFVVPADLSFGVIIWKCLVPPLTGVEFAGGLYQAGFSASRWFGTKESQIESLMHLGRPVGTFFGVRLDILRQIRQALLGDWNELGRLPILDIRASRPSQLNWLRDGTVSGPEDFFQPVRAERF